MRNSLFTSLFFVSVTLLAFGAAQFVSPRNECLELPNGICMKNKHIRSPNVDENLIAWFTFDENYPIDHSGKMHDAIAPLDESGPSFTTGASAAFNGTNYIQIPHSSWFDKKEMTITFWIYLREDSNQRWRTILHKGDSFKKFSPTLMLWPNERRLHLKVSTDYRTNEYVDSKGVLLLRKWTHITLILNEKLLQIYVNGLLDNEKVLKGTLIFNEGPLLIGRDVINYGTQCYIDELRIYSNTQKSYELRSMAYMANRNLDLDFAKLSCTSCSAKQAFDQCPNKYHLCTLKELNMGGYQLARQLGWLVDAGGDVWTGDKDCGTDDKMTKFEGDLKAGICCVDRTVQY